MRTVSAPGLAPSTEIGGQVRPQRDKIVPRKFGPVAKYLWRGKKPAAVIASIVGKDVRTGKRILRGEADVPVEVLLAVCAELLKPID